jgi:hypothetical protein
VFQDRLDDVGVVIDTELIRHGQQQRVGFRNRLVLLELLDEGVRLGRVAAAKDSALASAEKTDLVSLIATTEIHAVAVIGERKDAAAVHRAYLDLNRTLHGFAKHKHADHLHERGIQCVIGILKSLYKTKIRSQREFDIWHKTMVHDQSGGID